jgi:hypothetical protein
MQTGRARTTGAFGRQFFFGRTALNKHLFICRKNVQNLTKHCHSCQQIAAATSLFYKEKLEDFPRVLTKVKNIKHSLK